MPLISNQMTSTGTFTRWNPDGSISMYANPVSYRKIFTVSPSPCVNAGDHKNPTPYSFSIEEEVFPRGSRREWYRIIDWDGTRWAPFIRYFRAEGVEAGQMPWYNYSLAPSANDSYNRALSKLYDKVRESEVSMNTTIGEGRETFSLLRAVANSAAKVVKDLRALNRKLRFKRRIGEFLFTVENNSVPTVGSLWLGWSVGLKPLLSDIEALRQHVLSAKAESVLFTVKARATFSKFEELSNAVSNYYWPGDRGKYESLDFSERHELQLTYRIKDLNQYEVWRAGLTVRPSLAWELATLSFVIDYVYNIGQLCELLEASCFNNGIEFVSGYHTKTTRELRTFSLQWQTDRPVDPNGNITAHSANFTARKSRRTKSRGLLTELPRPMLPVIKVPSAATPLANVAALLSQLISRKTQP